MSKALVMRVLSARVRKALVLGCKSTSFRPKKQWNWSKKALLLGAGWKVVKL